MYCELLYNSYKMLGSLTECSLSYSISEAAGASRYNPVIAADGCMVVVVVGASFTVGVRRLTRGLATLHPRCVQEPLVVRQMEEPQEDLLVVLLCVAVVHCWEILG